MYSLGSRKPVRWSARALALVLLAVTPPHIGFATEAPIAADETRIRAYWSPPLELFDALQEAGFNTIIQRLEIAPNTALRASGSLHPAQTFQAVEAETLAASRRAKALGMAYFHCLDPGAARAVIDAGFEDNERRFHNGTHPCPLDDVYWERIMTGRFLSVIDLLAGEDCRLDGLIIDPEMYSFNGAFLTIPCFCDDCAREFSESNAAGTTLVTLPMEGRGDWLGQQQLLDRYETYQQDVVRGRVAAMRTRIHEKNPALQLGFLIFRERPWFKALAAGLATEAQPVLICPEGTYSGAFNDDYLAYQENLKGAVGAPYRLCPGIWVGYEPDDSLPTAFMSVVPGNVYHRSIRAAGYWVYATKRWGGTAEKAKPFTDIFRVVNDELDRYSGANGVYESPLRPQALPLERPGNLHELLLEARDWKLVAQVPDSVPQSEAHLALRGQHQLVVEGKKGQEITVTLQNFQLGTYTSSGRIMIYNPGMELIVDEVCGVNQRISHTFTVAWEGPYVVLASAGSGVPNAFSIDIAGAPWILAGERVTFNKRGGMVYFWVPDGQETVEITLAGSGKETVSYHLFRPDGTQAGFFKDVGDAQVHRFDSHHTPGIWSLEIGDIVDDGYFSVTGIQRYALDPAYVVVD